MSGQGAARSAVGTFYLILIQVVSRGLTFVGNQTLLRFVLPGHLGLAVQLEALSISVLYTARESLRVALQRTPQDGETNERGKARGSASQAAINAAWLVVVLGLLLGTIFGVVYLRPAGKEVIEAPHFMNAFWLYGAATLLELLSEPCFIVIQQHALFKDRARAETSAAIARCIAACITAIIMHRRGVTMSVLPFAIGQLFYGLILLIVYFWSASSVATSSAFSLFPTKLEGASNAMFSRLSRPLLALAGAFYGQSVFKWLLTQGDVVVLSLFADLQSQGIFALASNYGGLASRLLFQPIEESSRNAFGSTLATKTQTATKQPSTSPELVEKRQEALTYLSNIVRIYNIVITVPCITIVPQLFPIAIRNVLGSRSQWSSDQTSTLLSAYSYYLPFLAINGVLDAFVTSIASEAELGAQSLMMIGVTMIYLSAAYFAMTLMELGAIGLVYANIVNMVLRITFSFWFIRVWIQSNIPGATRTGQRSPFTTFVSTMFPGTICIVTTLLVFGAMQVQSQVKAAVAETSAMAQLSDFKIDRLGLDLFDLSYLFSASALLGSSILASERSFLFGIIEPMMPQKVRSLLGPYVSHKKTD